VAHKLAVTVLLMPDAHSPIVRACQEDGAEIGIPEGVAPDLVNWAHMTVIVVGVTLGE